MDSVDSTWSPQSLAGRADFPENVQDAPQCSIKAEKRNKTGILTLELAHPEDKRGQRDGGCKQHP